MEKKVFRSICAVAFSVLIILSVVFTHIIYSYYIDAHIQEEFGMTPFALLLSIIRPIVIISAGVLVVATLVASNVAKRIVEPINAIDLDNPEENDVYDEIAPLLKKICKQSRQLQRQIKEAKQKQAEFVTIIENMNEGLLVVDTKYEVLSYNKAIIDMLSDGVEPSTKSVFAINHSNKFRKLIKKALGGKIKEKVLEINEKYYAIIANPVYENGKIVGAVIIAMDITERIQRDNYRREFTANVTHELKTPLTSISGFAEIMKSSIVKPEDMPEMANSIYEEAQRLIVLVNDIIKLSALDDEQISYEYVDIYVDELIDEIQSRMKNVIEKKNITFIVKKEKVKLNAPKEIVSEMLYNLCDNAIKYNVDGGLVRIVVKEDRKKCYITIEDTGIGIDIEHQDRIFERFYRVDKSHSKEVGGTGLGLSIVKHDINFLDGTIKVESKLNEGTKMSISIPKKTSK